MSAVFFRVTAQQSGTHLTELTNPIASLYEVLKIHTNTQNSLLTQLRNSILIKLSYYILCPQTRLAAPIEQINHSEKAIVLVRTIFMLNVIYICCPISVQCHQALFYSIVHWTVHSSNFRSTQRPFSTKLIIQCRKH